MKPFSAEQIANADEEGRSYMAGFNPGLIIMQLFLEKHNLTASNTSEAAMGMRAAMRDMLNETQVDARLNWDREHRVEHPDLI